MPPAFADRRHFEDLIVGETIALGPVTLTEAMITGFARQFDPLPFHLDPEAAKGSLLGGLAASGWQTAGLSLRMLVDGFLGHVTSLGGLGFTNLKWRNPVLAGDTIAGTATVTGLRRSASRPEMGIATIRFDISNQNGAPVLSMRLDNMIATRHPEPSQGARP